MSKIIGYARVSTVEQNLDRQLIALKDAGCETIYQEKLTGKNTNRPELQRMLDELQTGDTVIVKELTRVSRSTQDMLQLVQDIADKGCYIKSLNETWLDSTSLTGELMLTIMAGISQFERRIILERCNEGRTVAMAKGVKFGRPRVGGESLKFAIELYKAKEMSVRKICEVTTVSKATLMRRVKEMGLTCA